MTELEPRECSAAIRAAVAGAFDALQKHQSVWPDEAGTEAAKAAFKKALSGEERSRSKKV